MARLSEHMRHCAQALKEEASSIYSPPGAGVVISTTYAAERFRQEASNYDDFARFIEERDALVTLQLDDLHAFILEGHTASEIIERTKRVREALAISYGPGVKVA